MKRFLFAASLLLFAGAMSDARSQDPLGEQGPRDVQGDPTTNPCPAPRIVEIRTADPSNRAHHDAMLRRLAENIGKANTTILLGPTVVLDFSVLLNNEFNDPDDDVFDVTLPLRFGSCVTLASVSWFASEDGAPRHGARPISGRQELPRQTLSRPAPRPSLGEAVQVEDRNEDAALGRRPPPDAIDVEDRQGEAAPPQIESARTSHSPGPLLKYGPSRAGRVDDPKIFLAAGCGSPNDPWGDHVRISGFRLQGPSVGRQETGENGIQVTRCIDVEISNMEIFGWGGSGVEIKDVPGEDPMPSILPGPAATWPDLRRLPGMCHEPPYNGPNGRIATPQHVRIFNNHIHHNQHPSERVDGEWHEWPEWHAAGYGVSVGEGAWAQIYQNVFDYNRHAIAARGDAGGYEATLNLVLRRGGVHEDDWWALRTWHTHQFDIHGTIPGGKGGFAGSRFLFSQNAFQYLSDNAIFVRGSPRCGIQISHNIFPHEGLEHDKGDDAVNLYYREDLDVIQLGPNNTTEDDSFGQYEVCDFDGDQIDDLFLATGVSWWFSGRGEHPWTFLSARSERLDQIRFGYFDDDHVCDVLKESGGRWMISSGGRGRWHIHGENYAPLSEVHFGRFDPRARDHRPGATRRTTHAFWRRQDGRWLITPLTGADQRWQEVGGSSFPMDALRFGDFTGDGVTNVLALEQNRWAISESARGEWRAHNPTPSDDLRALLFADLNNNNIDDILRIEIKDESSGNRLRMSYTWWISDDGVMPWRALTMHRFSTRELARGFAGRFGSSPGGAVLLVYGHGYFYGEAPPRQWESMFDY